MMPSLNIGILTFHAQQNYGGVLQAFALQQALSRLFPAAEVRMVDRWISATNGGLQDPFAGVKMRGRLFLRLLMRLGDWAPETRRTRTRRWICSHMALTPDHFADWAEFVARRLPVPEVLVVGSDQVWHAGKWGDPRVYLLHGAPAMRAIAYAASFGMTREDAREMAELYREGLPKFAAISCREAEGIAICADLNLAAEHVVDPTLLVGREFWRSVVRPRRSRRSRLFAYVLSEDVQAVRERLETFGGEMDCMAELFSGNTPSWWWGPMPKNVRTLREWWRALRRRRCDRARMRLDAGPQEFLDSIAAADWVVTDSFHALMFAIIFKRNVRVLRPRSESRRQMFARIEEFAAHATGPLIADDLDAALSSFRRGETVAFDEPWLEARRRFSADWLTAQIEAARKAVGK